MIRLLLLSGVSLLFLVSVHRTMSIMIIFAVVT